MSFPLRRADFRQYPDGAEYGFADSFRKPAHRRVQLRSPAHDHKTFGLSAELPVAIYPRMNLNYRYDLIPKDIGALFVTPSVRLNFFPGQGVSPWVSAGGGYGRFREAPTLVWADRTPGPPAPIPA